jgi:hypothetical protein
MNPIQLADILGHDSLGLMRASLHGRQPSQSIRSYRYPDASSIS